MLSQIYSPDVPYAALCHSQLQFPSDLSLWLPERFGQWGTQRWQKVEDGETRVFLLILLPPDTSLAEALSLPQFHFPPNSLALWCPSSYHEAPALALAPSCSPGFWTLVATAFFIFLQPQWDHRGFQGMLKSGLSQSSMASPQLPVQPVPGLTFLWWKTYCDYYFLDGSWLCF